MSSRRLAKISLAAGVVMMIVSVAGFIVALVLNTFFLDKYNAYGEVHVPGASRVHLPAGEVTISLHTVVIGGPNGGGLPVPPLGVTITPPEGVALPVVKESRGSTTTVNNDAHVRVWVAQIPADATYDITTDGQVNGYIDPQLAFGHSSSYGYLGVGVRCHVRCGPGRFDLVGNVAGPHPAQSGGGGGGHAPLRGAIRAHPRGPRTHRRGSQARATQNACGVTGFRCAD